MLLLLLAPVMVRGQHTGCHVSRVTDLPGSHAFAADFIEAMVSDPAPTRADVNVVWALTADLSSDIPEGRRALHISKSADGGRTWAEVARIGPRYLDAQISEGLRNGLAVSPGGRDFVVTTQEGAFQVLPAARPNAAVVRKIDGPVVPATRSDVTIAKKPGEPVRAGVVLITADGRRMIVAYGYFDDDPQLIAYRRAEDGTWAEDGTLPKLPTNLDIFSMQFDDPHKASPASLYVGMGDQAYHLNFAAGTWTMVRGVGPDSAIHSMSLVGGPHFAACWGVYTPVNADTVARVTQARFLLHRAQDEVGPNIRAYAIAVDPMRPEREILAAITGVYASADSGQSWKRLNELPEGEFHSAHFNADGSVIVSGYVGTFVVDPFAEGCGPRLRRR